MPRITTAFLAALIWTAVAYTNAFTAMSTRVDGNNVYYTAGQMYAIDAEFVYIGAFTTTESVKAMNKLDVSTYQIINEVFGLSYNGTNELVQLFIAQWVKMPSGWKVGEPGPINAKYYDFKPTRFTGLADFLQNKGFTYSNEFYGGLMIGTGYSDTYTRYYFAISKSTIPKSVDNVEYLKSTFTEKVKQAVK